MKCEGALATALLPQFTALLGVPEQAVRVQVVRRGGLADSMEVLRVGTAAGERCLVALASPDSAPDAAARFAARTAAAAAALGPALSRHVNRPIASGWVAGRSYSIFPFLHELPSSPLRAMLVRVQLRRPVTDWLLAIASATAARMPVTAVPVAYERPLAAIVNSDDLPAAARRDAADATARLGHGSWQPASCVMHGDLWRGNFMLRPSGRNGLLQSPAEAFMVIDWAGSRLQGYPLFDLVRAAESLAFPPRITAAAMRRHCKVLNCQPHDVMGYVLAALGSIALAPGHFARNNLVELVDRSHREVRRALAHC